MTSLLKSYLASRDALAREHGAVLERTSAALTFEVTNPITGSFDPLILWRDLEGTLQSNVPLQYPLAQFLLSYLADSETNGLSGPTLHRGLVLDDMATLRHVIRCVMDESESTADHPTLKAASYRVITLLRSCGTLPMSRMVCVLSVHLRERYLIPLDVAGEPTIFDWITAFGYDGEPIGDALLLLARFVYTSASSQNGGRHIETFVREESFLARTANAWDSQSANRLFLSREKLVDFWSAAKALDPLSMTESLLEGRSTVIDIPHRDTQHQQLPLMTSLAPIIRPRSTLECVSVHWDQAHGVWARTDTRDPVTATFKDYRLVGTASHVELQRAENLSAGTWLIVTQPFPTRYPPNHDSPWCAERIASMPPIERPVTPELFTYLQGATA